MWSLQSLNTLNQLTAQHGGNAQKALRVFTGKLNRGETAAVEQPTDDGDVVPVVIDATSNAEAA